MKWVTTCSIHKTNHLASRGSLLKTSLVSFHSSL